MAKIRIDLKEPFLDGMDIKFKAPCDCTAIDGMIVYYPLDDDSSTGSQSFVFKDAHGNNLAGLGNLFTKDAVVKVIVDRSTSSAYIQNAATNKYLENKIANAGSKVTLSSSVSSTSTTTAANSYAVKQAYDKGVSALSTAQSAQTAANQATSVANAAAKETTISVSITNSGFYEATIYARRIGSVVFVRGEANANNGSASMNVSGLPDMISGSSLNFPVALPGSSEVYHAGTFIKDFATNTHRLSLYCGNTTSACFEFFYIAAP